MDKRPLDQIVENRDEVRFSLSGKLPVNFFHGPQKEAFEALFVDISNRGLGLLVESQSFNIGDTVLMVREDQDKTIEFKVIWLKKTKMRGTSSELMRIGLSCTDPQMDLLKEFEDSSLIDM